LDALAIFPYYIESYDKSNGLLSIRLLRLFRVFQLLRLGQYNSTFASLINVFFNSLLSLNILIIVLLFGAAFFGSMIYWLEKGTWTYTDYTDPPSYMFMRIGADGVTEEPSPFTSIPSAFWWFIVTATTVGYGDVYPTSMSGKVVGACAMLLGVLVIAFPVSVFSDLWSKELKKAGALVLVESDDDDKDNTDDDDPNDNNGHGDAVSEMVMDDDVVEYNPVLVDPTDTTNEIILETPRHDDELAPLGEGAAFAFDKRTPSPFVEGTTIPLTIETPTPRANKSTMSCFDGSSTREKNGIHPNSTSKTLPANVQPLTSPPVAADSRQEAQHGSVTLSKHDHDALLKHMEIISKSQQEIQLILLNAPRVTAQAPQG
jgi:hypothetical protein